MIPRRCCRIRNITINLITKYQISCLNRVFVYASLVYFLIRTVSYRRSSNKSQQILLCVNNHYRNFITFLSAGACIHSLMYRK